MSDYKIFETDSFLTNLEEIQPDIRKKVYQKITNYVYPQMKNIPFYGPNIKKLVNYNPETWRYRIGDYRLFYEIDKKEKIICIIALELRDKAY